MIDVFTTTVTKHDSVTIHYFTENSLSTNITRKVYTLLNKKRVRKLQQYYKALHSLLRNRILPATRLSLNETQLLPSPSRSPSPLFHQPKKAEIYG